MYLTITEKDWAGKSEYRKTNIPLESKEAPLWWQEQGLMFTSTGYGKRIPTRYMVRYNGKWRRVYCCIYSNNGTCYIGKLSDGLIIGD